MKHRFVVLVDGILKEYNDYNSIPSKFDNLIEFLPYIPEPPHAPAQHDEIESWNIKLKELMKRETNASYN